MSFELLYLRETDPLITVSGRGSRLRGLTTASVRIALSTSLGARPSEE